MPPTILNANMYARREARNRLLDATQYWQNLRADQAMVSLLPGLDRLVDQQTAMLECIGFYRNHTPAELSRFLEVYRDFASVITTVIQATEAIILDYDGDAHETAGLRDRIKHSQPLEIAISSLLRPVNIHLADHAQELTQVHQERLHQGERLSRQTVSTIWEAMCNIVTQIVQHFKLEGINQIQENLRDIAREIREQQDTENRALIESIHRAPASHSSLPNMKQDFLQGTWQELFVELCKWAGGDMQLLKRQIYFLGGAAGLGKSAIAHQLCSRACALEWSSSRLGASFFFVRGSGDAENAHLLFPTLTYQLASHPTLRRPIITTAREYLKRADRFQMTCAFQELFRKALIAAPSSNPILLVIDGLDECRDRALVPTLLRSLVALVREIPWLYIFVAARPEPHILSVLTAPESDDVVYHRRLDDLPDPWTNNVERYLRVTVPKLPSYTAFVHNHPEALDCLVKRASGIFAFARVAVSFLEAWYPARPKEGFERILSNDSPVASPLDALYLEIIRLAATAADELSTAVDELPTAADDPLQPQLKSRCLLPVLRCVSLSYRPVSPSLIASFHGSVSTSEVFRTVDHLRSVLFIDKNGCIQPLHKSFLDFLVDEERCTEARYLVDILQGHAYLASACMAAVTTQQVSELIAPSGRDRHPQSGLSLLEYAIPSGWHWHLQQAEYTSKLAQQVKDFVLGPQLMAYLLWAMSSGEEVQDNVIQVLWNYLQGHTDRSMICAEFFKSTIYVTHWWNSVAYFRERGVPVTLENIKKNALFAFDEEGEMLPYLERSVRDSDLGRYRSLVDRVFEEISQNYRYDTTWHRRW